MIRCHWQNTGGLAVLRHCGLPLLACAIALTYRPTMPNAEERFQGAIRGVVKAVEQASLSTDIASRVLRLPFREGEHFEKGALLVEFDCRRQRAELEALHGALREAKLNLSTSVTLDRYKAIGRNDVKIARARLQKAQGELNSLSARVEDCIVKAPFSGRVAESLVRELEFTAPQRPYLTIVGDRNLEIEAIVSSAMLASLEPGNTMRFRVDELNNVTVAAIVTSVGAVIDPVSKTVKIKAAVQDPPRGLTAGMSGTALLSPMDK